MVVRHESKIRCFRLVLLSWRWTGDGWGCKSNNITRSCCVWGNFLRSSTLRQDIYSSQNSITSDKISYYLNYANPPETEKTSESRDSTHRVCFKSKRYVKRIVSKRKWLNKCCHRKWQNSFAQKECIMFLIKRLSFSWNVKAIEITETVSQEKKLWNGPCRERFLTILQLYWRFQCTLCL